MQLSFDPKDSWLDRSYKLVDDGDEIERLGDQPTLDELREVERRRDERIQLDQGDLLCTECNSPINGRFGADMTGQIRCWNCAMEATHEQQGNVSVNVDPTKAVLSESSLHKKSLCDYVINVATGCRHGCKFCYVPTTPAVSHREEMLNEKADVDDAQLDWGSYLLYRDDLPERLHEELRNHDPEDWKRTNRGRGVVMLSSGTDCYQDRRAAQITRGCIQELVKHDIPVRVLSRSPNMTRDIDLFKEAGDNIIVGSSIPTLKTELARAMEPNAPPPMARFEALDEISRAGVPVYVSMSPTYPTTDEHEIRNMLSLFAALEPEVIFHEPVNPRGENFQMCFQATKEAGFEEVARQLEKLQDPDIWVHYALMQINQVQRIAEEFEGIQVHSWPDRKLVDLAPAKYRHQLKEMRKARSPEPIGSDFEGQSASQSTLADSMDEVDKTISV